MSSSSSTAARATDKRKKPWCRSRRPRVAALDHPPHQRRVPAHHGRRWPHSANEKHVQICRSPTRSPRPPSSTSAGRGAIDPPAGTTDLLAVSNGVIKRQRRPTSASPRPSTTRCSSRRTAPPTPRLMLGYKKSFAQAPRRPAGSGWATTCGCTAREGTTRVAGGHDGIETLEDATGLPTFGHYFRLGPGHVHQRRPALPRPLALRPGRRRRVRRGSARPGTRPGTTAGRGQAGRPRRHDRRR